MYIHQTHYEIVIFVHTSLVFSGYIIGWRYFHSLPGKLQGNFNISIAGIDQIADKDDKNRIGLGKQINQLFISFTERYLMEVRNLNNLESYKGLQNPITRDLVSIYFQCNIAPNTFSELHNQNHWTFRRHRTGLWFAEATSFVAINFQGCGENPFYI